ncbi:3-dehydroquinate synthase [Corynebacterium choanae]|uniref:3-dehydroquinate synthase n=1 Tax=Corynebacterium choanae TaxID=1862358 RepID=A0A3G6J6D8_9CORY|nr:3-dehydroquinate synthase [Corynebacterium choanae]AZA13671.1 3-dehydroquinate synthase [Corynebacterium choanae]
METKNQPAHTITVQSPTPYTVTIGTDLAPQLTDHIAQRDGVSTVAIIYQENLAAACEQFTDSLQAAGLKVIALPIADAEAGKTFATCQQCWDVLGEHSFGRRDVVVGLGGGAATDLAGFVAAAWMRGVQVVQVPTTLLGMVDAAVGGKTGINTPRGKNLVGAFHEPAAVFCDLRFLDTLPAQELISGSAEIIKAGFIVDPRIVELYQQYPAEALHNGEVLAELIARAIQVKADVVGQDFKESNLRMILNYGHTLAHAIEQREDYQWRHGNAVAVGMVFAACLAHVTGRLDRAAVATHVSVLQSIGLPTTYDPDAFDELFATMLLDKKNVAGRVRFVLLAELQQPEIVDGIERAQCEQAYAMMLSLADEQ